MKLNKLKPLDHRSGGFSNCVRLDLHRETFKELKELVETKQHEFLIS